MDEKLVEQISTDTGVPQELVSRSAQARAQANGVDVNAILASWSSGEAWVGLQLPLAHTGVDSPAVCQKSRCWHVLQPKQRSFHTAARATR